MDSFGGRGTDVTGWARKTLDARFKWLSQQTGDALAWVNERSTAAEAAQALVVEGMRAVATPTR